MGFKIRYLISLGLHNIIFHGVFQLHKNHLFFKSSLINWICMITGPSVDRDVKKSSDCKVHLWILFMFSFYISQTLHRSSTVHNLSSKRRKKNIWNVMRSALKGLVLELKGISCTLPVFCLETGPSPDPHCWINARHFLRSAHPAGQNHFSYFFFLRNGRSAFTAGWYNTGVTFWQGIWCRFQVAPSNYSSDYFQTAIQLRSALGWV